MQVSISGKRLELRERFLHSRGVRPCSHRAPCWPGTRGESGNGVGWGVVWCVSTRVCTACAFPCVCMCCMCAVHVRLCVCGLHVCVHSACILRARVCVHCVCTACVFVHGHMLLVCAFVCMHCMCGLICACAVHTCSHTYAMCTHAVHTCSLHTPVPRVP